MPRKRTIVLDLDGTLVENKWPELGGWMPGAVEACKRFHAAGHTLVLHSCRLSPVHPFTGNPNDPEIVQREHDKVRSMLDAAGLHFVKIHTGPGKPGGFIYIDDRAERYHGTAKAWDRLADKVLLRLGEEVDA